MALVRRMFALSLCFFVVFASINNENNENLGENYNEEVAAFVSHLNSVPVKVYKYRDPTLKSVHQKADLSELVVDLSVDCIQTTYPDLPCEDSSLTCNGFVQKPPGQQPKVLGEIKCKRRNVNTPKSVPEIEITPPQSDNVNEEPDFKQSIVLSNEAASSESGERFVAVRRDSVPCLGCPFDLNTNAEGVDELTNLAVKHVESERDQKQLLVRVLRLQQQVVAGIKYILLAEIAPSLCTKDAVLVDNCAPDIARDNAICQITFLQKPWIDKTKHVIGNNCTVSQEFAFPSKTGNEIDNEILVGNGKLPAGSKPAFSGDHFDEIAQSGRIEEEDIMPPSRLFDLESQILIEQPTPQTSPNVQLNAQDIVEAVEAFEAQNHNQSPPVIESVEVFTTVPEELELTGADTILTVPPFSNLMQSDQPTVTDENIPSTTQSSNLEVIPSSTFGTVATNNDSSEESSEEKSGVKAENNDSNSSSSEESTTTGKRQKRAIRQLVKISPEEKPFIKDLSDVAAAALDGIDDDNHRRVVLQILGAKRTIGGEDGTTYSLILRMGISKCLENRPIDSDFNCREKLFEHYTKICKVQVHVDEDNLNPKLVKSQCQNIKRDKDDSNKNRTNYSRYRRQVPGGISDADKDKPEVAGLVTDALVHLDGKTSHENKLKVGEIKSATHQVVAGTIWRIKAAVVVSDCKKSDEKKSTECGNLEPVQQKVCDFVIWDQPWVQNGKQTNITCEDDASTTHTFRSKRSTGPVLGGQTEADKNDPIVTEYLKGGLGHLDSKSSDDKKLTVVNILSVTKQVVSGFLYRIKAEIALSDCDKNDSKDFGDCKQLEGAASKICDFKIWDQSWLPNGRETNITCENEETTHSFRAKRSIEGLVGGQSEADKNDPIVTEYLRGGLGHLDSKSSDDKKLTVVNVLSVTKQVVAGSLYQIKAEVVLSECDKNDSKDFGECKQLEGAASKICNFKIWDQPWLTNGRETNITCENEDTAHSFRAKRSVGVVKGGETEADKKDPIVTEYLRGGLGHLDSKSSDDKKLTVVNLLSVTKQVVSGSLYRIKAEVALSECDKNDSKDFGDCKQLEGAASKICNFKIWDQPWLTNGRETNITCENEETSHSFRAKRSIGGLLGGQIEADKNDPIVSEYLRGGLGHLDSTSSNDKKLTVVNVLSITKQVVGGTLYRIKAEVALSECDKDDTKDFGECRQQEGTDSKICNFKIFDRPWLPNGRETSITCENDETEFVFTSDGKSAKSSKLIGQDDHDVQRLQFKDYLAKFGKIYDSQEEFKYRFKVFRENLKYVRLLNENERGTARYGLTKFADLTRDEFSSGLGLREDLRSENEVPLEQAEIPDVDLPVEFDWRKKGVVSEVKNQQQCGSCWAFSVTGNIEGQYAIKHGQLLEFSEQELVDCDKSDDGCNGGLMDNAYRSIEKLGGLETEKDYPYDAEDETCHFNKTLARVQLTGAVNISQDETDMAKWLVQNGPISIAINANAMQFYVGGVSHPYKFLCNPKSLDHGVLIVGFGVHKYPLFNKTLPYWIVKNSWGPSWGEQGYYRVYRGDGTCGVNQTPSSGIVA